MKKFFLLLSNFMLLGLLLLLAACGPTVNKIQQQQTVTVNKSFQAQVVAPTAQPYRCGAWASNTSPRSQETITIYARLTKDVAGIAGATAKAVVHFSGADQVLDQQPTSDAGGYANFTLPLMGRQPLNTPATVEVSFTVNGTEIQCSRAFFTPL